MSIDDIKLRAGLFLGQFHPATDGNYKQPMSMVADKHIKAFAEFIRALPDEPETKDQPDKCAGALAFARQVADAAALCESTYLAMEAKRDAKAQWGQSKEYQAAYHAHNDAVNARHLLLRDNHKKIEQMALALVTSPVRESMSLTEEEKLGAIDHIAGRLDHKNWLMLPEEAQTFAGQALSALLELFEIRRKP